MSNKLYIMLIVASVMNFGSSTLPPNIKVCHRNSPKLAECFKSSMESLRPLLKQGKLAPGFNVEPLDPLFIGDASVSSGFELKLFKLSAYGASNFKIDKIRVNVDKVKFEVILSVPSIMTRSGYSINWQIGLLNLQGKGECFGYLDNVKILVKFSGSTYKKSGADYIKINDVKVDIKPARTSVRFENLFNGQKELERVGNEVINQNIEIITKDVIPQFERGIEKKIFDNC